MVSFDYRGRVVIVTGVGRPGQIGHATALAFARAGAQLVLCDVNATGVAERAKEFHALGLDARPAAGDLTEPDIARLAVETAVRNYGRLDALVNIAGGLTTYGPIEGATVRAFDREVGINLKTAVIMSQAAIDELAKTHGSIVNVASVAYFQPQANMAIYAAAKAGVAGFTRSLAAELLPRSVRVNAIAPGDGAHPRECRRGRHRCHLRRDAAHHRRDHVPRQCRRRGHQRPGAAHLPGRGLVMQLAGRVALVTGAGRRLGRAFAGALGARGMTMALHYNASRDGAESLRQEIEAAGGRAACFPADLADAGAARALAGRVAAEFGQLDVLVNSAAVMHHVGFDETTPELYDEVLNLNLRSVFFVSQGAAPYLRRARGKIVNLADLGGLEPWPGLCGAFREQGRRGHADARARAEPGSRGDGERDCAGLGAGARRVRRCRADPPRRVDSARAAGPAR